MLGVIRPAQTAEPSPRGAKGQARGSMPLCRTLAVSGAPSGHQRGNCWAEATVKRDHADPVRCTTPRSHAKGGTCSDVTIGSRRSNPMRGG